MLALLLAWPLTLDAKPVEPPRMLFTAPLVVTTGAPVKLILRGAKLDTVTGVQVNSLGVAVRLTTAGKKIPAPDNYSRTRLGESEAEIELTVPADYAGETVAVAVVNPGGTSNVLAIPVAKKSIKEIEPNHGFAFAQLLQRNDTVDGVLQQPQDVDVFRIDGTAGQTLNIDIAAARLGSPADVRVTLYDARFREVAAMVDARAKPDPAITAKLPTAGVYYISVQEASDLGGPLYGYRLTVK